MFNKNIITSTHMIRYLSLRLLLFGKIISFFSQVSNEILLYKMENSPKYPKEMMQSSSVEVPG